MSDPQPQPPHHHHHHHHKWRHRARFCLEFHEEQRPRGGSKEVHCFVAGPIAVGHKEPVGYYFHLAVLKQQGLWGESPPGTTTCHVGLYLQGWQGAWVIALRTVQGLGGLGGHRAAPRSRGCTRRTPMVCMSSTEAHQCVACVPMCLVCMGTIALCGSTATDCPTNRPCCTSCNRACCTLLVCPPCRAPLTEEPAPPSEDDSDRSGPPTGTSASRSSSMNNLEGAADQPPPG